MSVHQLDLKIEYLANLFHPENKKKRGTWAWLLDSSESFLEPISNEIKKKINIFRAALD